jgi:hypothetical protein
VDIEKYQIYSLHTHNLKIQHPSKDFQEGEINNILMLLKNGESQTWNRLIRERSMENLHSRNSKKTSNVSKM